MNNKHIGSTLEFKVREQTFEITLKEAVQLRDEINSVIKSLYSKPQYSEFYGGVCVGLLDYVEKRRTLA